MSIMTFIIVCPMVFLAGMVDAIGGGGGLISLPAYLIAGVPAHHAVATNKLSSTTGTVVSTIRYYKNGFADIRLAIPGIIAALLGSQIGARAALIVSAKIFTILLMVLLPVIAIYMLLKKDLQPGEGEISRKKQYMIVTIAGVFIGAYDGFYGPGTGTFLILVYTGLAKMDVLTAGGNTKLVNLTSNISSLVVFLLGGVVYIPLGLAAGVFSIAGHYIGAGLAMKNGSRFVRIVILCVIGLLFANILYDFIMG